MYSSASLVADNEIEEHAPFEETSTTPFHKWPRKEKRAFVERFCTITVPPNQNGSSKNLQLACNCCGKVFRGQLITALVHLAGARKGGQRISICPTPNEELKAEVLHLFSLDHVHSEDALNEEALHIGEHFHHPNMVDIQLQQQQHFMQASNKLTTARDRATAKRKRDYAIKTLSVDPANPIDVAILRFLADADLKPKVLELESFQEMAKLLRAAPKSYQLPGVNRPEEGAYERYNGTSGGSGSAGSVGGVGGVSSGAGSGSAGVSSGGVSSGSSGANMVHSMMQMGSVHNLSATPNHGLLSHNEINNHIHHTHHVMNPHTTLTAHAAHHPTHHALTTHASAMSAHAALQAQHEAHKRARHGYTTSASVEAGVDSDSDGSVHTIPQM